MTAVSSHPGAPYSSVSFHPAHRHSTLQEKTAHHLIRCSQVEMANLPTLSTSYFVNSPLVNVDKVGIDGSGKLTQLVSGLLLWGYVKQRMRKQAIAPQRLHTSLVNSFDDSNEEYIYTSNQAVGGTN